MINRRDALQDLLQDHARYAWDEEAARLISRLPIVSVSARQAGTVTEGLCIPVGIPFDAARPMVTADCFGVALIQLHPFEAGQFPEFSPVPGTSWLWRNRHGALMLAFNLIGYIERFIEFGEEREVQERDAHARLPFEAATLNRLGVLHEPLLNKYLFAILAVAKGHANGVLTADPSAHVLPPALVLSHDCDQLRGNDRFTQAVRLYRFLAPMKRLRLPAVSNLVQIVQNALSPRKYYFDDVLAMSDVEHQFGFRSVFYFLNGMGGRFGARSGSAIISEFVRRLRPSAEIGIHYNYKYVFDEGKLAEQIRELEELTLRPIRAGRAHYLSFDPGESFAVLDALDIRTDESIGFAQQNSFRLGFAGAFRTWCGLRTGSEPIVEIPMHFMDANTAPRDDVSDLRRMAAEVEKVGGLVTLLFHPGAFNSPEAPDLRGVYLAHLSYFRRKRYRSMLPSEITALLLDGDTGKASVRG